MSDLKDVKLKKASKIPKKTENGKSEKPQLSSTADSKTAPAAEPAPPKEPTPAAQTEAAPPAQSDDRAVITVMDEYSDEQLEEIKMCFTLFDKNATDTVPFSSIIDILRSLGLAPLEADMQKIGELDGLIGKECSFEQFVSIFHHFITSPPPIGYMDVVEAFNTVSDQNGVVYKFSMLTMMSALGEKMERDMVDQLLVPFEKKDDGSIDLKKCVCTLMGVELPDEKDEKDKKDKKKK